MQSKNEGPSRLREFAQTLWNDVWFGLKVFVGSPKFTLAAVLTLALGIAVSTTVFSWIEGVLLHPYPGVTDLQGLALIETETPSGEHLVTSSYLDYKDYRDNLKLVSGLAIARFTPLSVGADGNTERAWAELVSANYFDVLKVKPILGRTFIAEEGADEPGGFPVAVISYKMWQRRFHGDPDVVGKTIRLNRHELNVVGVAPKEFHGSTVGIGYDIWMPITMASEMGTGDGTLNYRGCRDLTSTIVRLKPGIKIEQASAEVGAVAKRLAAAYPETNRGIEATVLPIWAGHLGAQGMLLKPLRILMAVCGLLLLIVCANVANMLLARAVSRQKEFGIRLAMGAQRGRLIQQLLTETLLLCAAGGAVGVLLVIWMGRSLVLLLPPMDLTLDIGGGLDWQTLGFTLLVVVVATLLSGLVPALLSVRKDLNSSLNEGGRGGIGGVRSHRLRGLLVGVEVALAMVALVGAGLFVRSFRNASRIDPGFDTKNVSMSQFYLSNAGYSADEQRWFCSTLRQRMEAVPGVIGVTYTDDVPLTSPTGAANGGHQLEVEGYVPAPNEQMVIHRATVPPGYFQLMGIAMREGRDFTERDDSKAPLVMIVNETFARRYFKGSSAIGRRVRVNGTLATVVAEVKDSRYQTPMETPIPFFYLPFGQWFAPGLNFSVLVKTSGDPMLMVPVLRREALALNQDAMFSSKRLTEAVGASLYEQKVAASLLSVVGGLCLLLAASGLYSVMSYSVSQRTQELGIRMALGARPAHVVLMVLGGSLRMTAPGLLVGVVASLAAFQFAGGMLVGVSATDPVTIAGSGLFLAAVTLIASYLPAQRAVRIDPMTALHDQ